MRKIISIATLKKRYGVREEWRPIAGYVGVYSVSNYGRVRRDAMGKGTRIGRILTPTRSGKYIGYMLFDEGVRYRSVHGLVAAAFIGERPIGLITHHINGQMDDNFVGNLRYITHAEAVRLGVKMGVRKYKSNINRNALSDKQVRLLRSVKLKRGDIAAYAREFGVTYLTIFRAVHGHSYKDIRRFINSTERREIQERIKRGDVLSHIARDYGASPGNISEIKRKMQMESAVK